MLPSSEDLGSRIAAYRKRAKKTQTELAEAIGCGRTTLVAIEKGERRPSSHELSGIAAYLATSLHDLLSPYTVQTGVSARFRMPRSGPNLRDEELERAVERLEALGRKYAKLERILGISQTPSRLRALMPDVSVHNIPCQEAITLGQDAAARLRGLLGLGDGQISDLNALLEYELSLRVFHLRDLSSRVAALLIFGREIGICIGVNAHQPLGRRNWGLLHELGHVLEDLESGDILPQGDYRMDSAEHFSDAFAKAFLLPATGVSRVFGDRKRANGGRFTPLDIAFVAKQFKASFEAVTRRLEELSLLRFGTYERLKSAGLSVSSLDLTAQPSALPDIFPQRYLMLVVVAYERELISEGELAEFLETDRVTARGIYHRLTNELAPGDGTSRISVGEDLVASV